MLILTLKRLIYLVWSIMSTFVLSGFNGFGQFGGVSQHAGNAFTGDLKISAPNSLLIAPSWSYTAYATDNLLLLRGFLSSTPNSATYIQTPVKITQLSTCDRFCLVLCENGKLHKIRPEISAKLEEVKFDVEVQSLPQKRSIFGETKQSDCFRIVQIACGANITVAVSATNAVYNASSKVYQFPKHYRVRQLQCGFEHALLLTTNGDIYSWGNGFRGQLGHDVLRVEESPLLIDALAGIKITSIAAGGWHSAAISAFGDLYAWGFNSNGQMGLRIFKSTSAGNIKQPTVFTLPQVVDLPPCICSRSGNDVKSSDSNETECPPVRVFAGARHTLLQMSCGALYAAGWNAYGQLGLGRKVEFCDEFENVPIIEANDKDINIICSAWCTILYKGS
ncbi:probable E3 ubiquitin-protein ligase HERC3 isoform X2 [Eurosta solidaginis]|uniref:probable E3 ubiquitin-protein ligase HERC3 isoform X2 n=1 Tax=Eurosta solidaginis TaxID=178769 RepID=UPI003530DC53